MNTMLRHKNILLPLVTIMISQLCFFSHANGKVHKHPKSKCTVKSSGGDYPTYTVFKADKPIFSPTTDGIAGVQFSQDGQYIILTSGDITGIDVKRGDFEFSLVVTNCSSEKTKGFVWSKCVKAPGMGPCFQSYVEDVKWAADNKTASYIYKAGKIQKSKKLDFSVESLP